METHTHLVINNVTIQWVEKPFASQERPTGDIRVFLEPRGGDRSDQEDPLALRHFFPTPFLSSDWLSPPCPRPPAQHRGILSARHFDFKLSVLFQINREDKCSSAPVCTSVPPPAGQHTPSKTVAITSGRHLRRFCSPLPVPPLGLPAPSASRPPLDRGCLPQDTTSLSLTCWAAPCDPVQATSGHTAQLSCCSPLPLFSDLPVTSYPAVSPSG